MFSSYLFAQSFPFVLTHDGLIDERALNKIKEIGTEVKSKLGVEIYVDVKENNGIDTKLPREDRIKLMREKDAEILKNLKSPYVVLILSIDQAYANILMSKSLEDKIDKNDILDGYVIPLLASKDKNTLFAKTSAATLNGYAQIADSLASSKGIKLDSSIGSEGKTASTLWRVFMYTLVLAGIFLYAIVVLRERKFKK